MGTEILVISFFTTPLIFLISVGLLFKRKFPNPKAIILLVLNTLFISYFIITGLIDGHILQAFLVGGFLLVPFQVLGVLAALSLGGKLGDKLGSVSNVT
jgi:hypothetical protein